MALKGNKTIISREAIAKHLANKKIPNLNGIKTCLLMESGDITFGLQDSFSSQEHLVNNTIEYILILQDNKLEELVYDDSGEIISGYTEEEINTMATNVCKYVLHIKDKSTRECFLEYRGGIIGNFKDRAEEELEASRVLEMERAQSEESVELVEQLLCNWEEERLSGKSSKKRIDLFGKTIMTLADNIKHYDDYVEELKFTYNNGALTKYTT
jgi:hypothetical protein